MVKQIFVLDLDTSEVGLGESDQSVMYHHHKSPRAKISEAYHTKGIGKGECLKNGLDCQRKKMMIKYE